MPRLDALPELLRTSAAAQGAAQGLEFGLHRLHLLKRDIHFFYKILYVKSCKINKNSYRLI